MGVCVEGNLLWHIVGVLWSTASFTWFNCGQCCADRSITIAHCRCRLLTRTVAILIVGHTPIFFAVALVTFTGYLIQNVGTLYFACRVKRTNYLFLFIVCLATFTFDFSLWCDFLKRKTNRLVNNRKINALSYKKTTAGACFKAITI